MEYRRQVVDEATDRLYVLEREIISFTKSFVQEERAFAKSVKAFTERVKIFQEEFSVLVHEELSDLKAINENSGRVHLEHIQKIHDEHAANIFCTTQELDKLHQKFYPDAKRFTQESRQTLDKIPAETLGHVHEEYTREAHDICNTINEVKSTLLKIQDNVTAVNREFTLGQKQFAMPWQTATNKIAATMDAFSLFAVKESEKLETMPKTLERVANQLQHDYSDNLDRMNALKQSTSENFQSTKLVRLPKCNIHAHLRTTTTLTHIKKP